MPDPVYRGVAEKRVAIVHAIADLTQELGAPPTPSDISDRTGIPAATLSRQLNALEKSGDVGRVYGGRGLVLKSTLIDDSAIMRGARRPLTDAERAVLEGFAFLQRALTAGQPVTLLAITAHMLDREARIVERLVRSLATVGYLIQHDGGYRLPETNSEQE